MSFFYKSISIIMIALVFPGQGSQTKGMIKDFYDNFPLVREIFDKISNSSQIDVKDIIFNDNNRSLDITEFTQISIFCASISIFSVIKNIYGSNFYDKINFLAGHSLGEYSALTASGSLDIYNCSKILKIRGKCMQESYPERESGMLAVIGIEVSKLENILKQNDKLFFEIANDNAPGQIVISAKTKDFEKIQLLLKDYGAKKIIPLNVSAGFHSSFMKNAKNIMNEELNKIEINDSNIPVISNYSALPVKKSSDILNNLKNQITNRVKWVETINFLKKNDINHIIEIGPNKILTGLNKRINSNFTLTNISCIKDLDNFKNVI